MAVSNGQNADQTTFNNAYPSRTQDSNTLSKWDLENPAPESGANVTNLQRNVNSVFSFLGALTNQVFNYLPTWASDIVGGVNDTVKARIEALVDLFDGTTGHVHDGTDGNAPKIDAANLDNVNLFHACYQEFSKAGVSGLTVDITSDMSGKVAGGGASAVGVLTSPPTNRIEIISTVTGTNIEDVEGQRVYGRITESGGTWTLSFFTNEAGVETAHNLALDNITVLFREVFTQSTRPTITPDVGAFNSLDLTSDIADATDTIAGKVTINAQTFGGQKTFKDGLVSQESVEFQKEIYSAVANDAAATGADATLSLPTKHVVRLTNGALTSIAGIADPTKAQHLILVNAVGANVTLKNNVGSSPEEGVLTGTGADLNFKDGATLNLFYDLTSARWRVVGGSGGGGGTFVEYLFDYTMLAGSVPSEEFTVSYNSGKFIVKNVYVKTTTPFDDLVTLGVKLNSEYVIPSWMATFPVDVDELASASVNRLVNESLTVVSLEVVSGSSDTANITQGACKVVVELTEVQV